MKLNFYYIFALKKKCRYIFHSTAMPPNIIHFHQKVDIKKVLESCDYLRTALFTGFYPHCSIFISTECNTLFFFFFFTNKIFLLAECSFNTAAPRTRQTVSGETEVEHFSLNFAVTFTALKCGYLKIFLINSSSCLNLIINFVS